MIAVVVTTIVAVALDTGMGLRRDEIRPGHSEVAAFAQVEPRARARDIRRELIVIVIVVVADTGPGQVDVRRPADLAESGVQALHRQQQQHDPGDETSMAGSHGVKAQDVLLGTGEQPIWMQRCLRGDRSGHGEPW